MAADSKVSVVADVKPNPGETSPDRRVRSSRSLRSERPEEPRHASVDVGIDTMEVPTGSNQRRRSLPPSLVRHLRKEEVRYHTEVASSMELPSLRHGASKAELMLAEDVEARGTQSQPFARYRMRRNASRVEQSTPAESETSHGVGSYKMRSRASKMEESTSAGDPDPEDQGMHSQLSGRYRYRRSAAQEPALADDLKVPGKTQYRFRRIASRSAAEEPVAEPTRANTMTEQKLAEPLSAAEIRRVRYGGPPGS